MKKSPKKHNKINIFRMLLLPLYIALIFLISDQYSGYFVDKRINADNQIEEEIRIAIIDTAFDISKFDQHKIENPLNVQDNTNVLIETPTFDYSGNLQFSDHGTSIINLFIGKHGLLRNAKIIPIQITSANNLSRALEYAIAQGAQIITISLSFGKSYNPFPFFEKIALLNASQNIPILIAAGNEGLALEQTVYGQSLISTALQSNGRIWLVGATKLGLFNKHLGICEEIKTNFTNYPITEAGKSVFLWAPGQNIVLGSLFKQMFTSGVSGTSIAAPIAAIQAIYYAKKNNISITQALAQLNKICVRRY